MDPADKALIGSWAQHRSLDADYSAARIYTFRKDATFEMINVIGRTKSGQVTGYAFRATGRYQTSGDTLRLSEGPPPVLVTVPEESIFPLNN